MTRRCSLRCTYCTGVSCVVCRGRAVHVMHLLMPAARRLYSFSSSLRLAVGLQWLRPLTRLCKQRSRASVASHEADILRHLPRALVTFAR